MTRSIEQTTLHSNSRFSVERWNVLHEDDKLEFVFVRKRSAVGLIATRNGRLLLTHQYRPLLGASIYELPGGAIDKGETPEEAAARELQEETGFRPSSLRLFWRGMFNHSLSDEVLYVFECGVGSSGAYSRDASESDLELAWMPIEDAISQIRTSDQFGALDGLIVETWFARRFSACTVPTT